MLDFGYGISVAKTFSSDVDLVCEVISLSHRFEVKELTKAAATAACENISFENSIRLYEMFTMYGCSQKETVMLFIARRLKKFGQYPDFMNVSVDDLERLVHSKEAIVDEMALFTTIRTCLKQNPSYMGTDKILKVFSAVHFEHLDANEMYAVRSEKGIVPEEVLFSSLDRASSILKSMYEDEEWDGALTVLSGDHSTSKSSCNCIEIGNWLFEASVIVIKGALTFRIRFLRRRYAETLSDAQEEFASAVFSLKLRLICGDCKDIPAS